MVRPAVIVLAHTATSYTLGRDAEADLTARMEQESGARFITAFGSVIRALTRCHVRRVAFGTPYGESATLQCKSNLESYGFAVANFGRLEDVVNIYDETSERAAQLALRVDAADADAVFLSGVGMPTVDVLDRLEQKLGKPVISSASAMMWNALRSAGVGTAVTGFGSLLADGGQ
jgi:maleate cis-trans isomerase